jgi:hypothetical protein
MLTEICQYLHNWFDKNQAKFYGKFEISDGVITSFNDGDMGMVEGQYFRILGSLLNDGVHQYPSQGLKDETFDGAVWFCAIPPAVIALSKDISEWQAKFGGASSEAMSPFQSESFGGYSYSKSSGGSTESGGGNGGWQSTFAYRLKPWRKLP